MNNNRSLFIASFFTLIAAGMGFGIRTGVLGDWGSQFGFTKIELGEITGGGLVGFGVVILLASLILDRVGYKSVLVVAFILHVLSAIVTVAATPIFDAAGKDAAYWCLYIGMFMFAVANGLCEAVINPLVATLYPNQKTHYLNILHAGWPGGLVVGGILGFLFVGPDAYSSHLRWEIPILFFLAPTLFYGAVILRQPFPESDVKVAGVRYGQMFLNYLSPMFIFLLVLHACVGYVELGTDSWITSITESILAKQGFLLFIYASMIMFVLRFFAGPIVEKINPLGLLLASACVAAIGLFLIGFVGTAIMVWIAVTIYGLGKTFFWPTMLGVVGERFPKGGAVTMGTIGGVGMLSAGLLGGPGIGYKQDYYASHQLKQEAPKTYERYAADKANKFLFLPPIRGLDGAKVGVILDKSKKGPGTELAETVALLKKDGKENKDIAKLEKWWESAKKYVKTEKITTDDGKTDMKRIYTDKEPVKEAGIYGGRMALRMTALVPAAMAIGYLLLVIFFWMKGGYQAEVLHGQKPEGEKYTGGVEGPMEG